MTKFAVPFFFPQINLSSRGKNAHIFYTQKIRDCALPDLLLFFLFSFLLFVISNFSYYEKKIHLIVIFLTINVL